MTEREIRGCTCIQGWLATRKGSNNSENMPRLINLHLQVLFLEGFFNGAAQAGSCGCGAWLRINSQKHFFSFLAWGQDRNIRAELIALWELLSFAKWHRLENLAIFGDSITNIEVINGRASLSIPNLINRLERIEHLKMLFKDISFKNIYRELNSIVDGLSRKGLLAAPGSLYYRLCDGDRQVNEGEITL